MNAWNSIFFSRMYVKMHEILCFYYYYFEWKCMFECLIFYFWFSWTIMHILNEWNSIFHFLFSWMIMHEILFSWIIIFDANVCTKFLNDFTNDFLIEFFKDNVSKRYVLFFQKRRYVQTIFSMIFKCFKIYVQRNIFNDFFQCLFKKYVQRFFEIYIFYVHSKEFFNDFIFV